MLQPLSPKIQSGRKGMRFLMNVRRDPLNFFVNLMEEEGSYAWFEIMGEKVLLLNDAKGIQHVLKDGFSDFHKGKFYKALKPLLGEGIFLSEESLWMKQRKESAPIFKGGNFPEMTQQMIKAGERLLDRFEQNRQTSGIIDINEQGMWYTLDVLLSALYHEDRENIAHDMKKSLGNLLSEAERRIWGAFILPQGITYKFPKYRDALGFLNNIVSDLVDTRKQNQKHPRDLLSTLVTKYKDIPKEQQLLRDQIMSFLLAGHETTANALSWCFYEISHRPEVRDNIINEIQEVIGSEELCLENISRLSYTTAVFKEALRLYPPVWTMSRTAVTDSIVPVEGGVNLLVPKNTTVMLCAYAVHRREKYWDNPCAFKPERFLGGSEDRPMFSYFPFNMGPRMCLGHKFAIIESLVALVMILTKYELSLVPGQDIKPEPIITLRPSRAMQFKIKKQFNF